MKKLLGIFIVVLCLVMGCTTSKNPQGFMGTWVGFFHENEQAENSPMRQANEADILLMVRPQGAGYHMFMGVAYRPSDGGTGGGIGMEMNARLVNGRLITQWSSPEADTSEPAPVFWMDENTGRLMMEWTDEKEDPVEVMRVKFTRVTDDVLEGMK